MEGAHPFARTRKIQHTEIREYFQFGINSIVARDYQGEFVNNHLSQAIQQTIKIMLLFSIEVIMTYKQQETASNDLMMDWPNINMTLRSGESISQEPAVYDVHQDTRTFVTVRADKRVEYMEFNPQSETMPTYSGPGQPRTTVDFGGVCHRSSVIKLTEAELNTLIAYDTCFVVEKNTLNHTLRCEKLGDEGFTNFTFNTTSVMNTKITDIYNSHAEFRKCKNHKPKSTYTRGNITRTNIKPELSLSQRVRISPLWSLVRRLSSITPQTKLEPNTLWSQTQHNRMQNPKWTEHVSPSAETWNTQWVVDSKAHTCEHTKQQHYAYADWAINADRPQKCNDFFQDIDPACLQSIAEEFDICQLEGMGVICGQLQNIQQQLTDVNAQANAYTNVYDMLYNPSSFVPSDGLFAWDTVFRTYDNLGITTDCNNPVFTSEQPDTSACAGDIIYLLIKKLTQTREIILTFVDIAIIIMRIGVQTIVLLINVFLSNPVNEQTQKILDNFADLLEATNDLLQVYMEFVWEWLKKTFLGDIFKIINIICHIIHGVLDVIIQILSSLTFFSNVEKALHNVEDFQNSLNCDIGPEEVEGEPQARQAITGTRCYAQNKNLQLPTNLLGGFISTYSCGPASMCMKDITSTDPAIACATCPGVYGSYQCDMTTKMCVCGVKSYSATGCFTNGECYLQASVCEMKVSWGAYSIGTRPCLASRSSSFCYREYGRQGICTNLQDTTLSDFRQCVTENLISNSRCLGIDNAREASAVTLDETYAITCSSLESKCMPVIDESLQSRDVLLVMGITSQSRRRLLFAEHNHSQDLHANSLQYFISSAKGRIFEIPGDCGDILRQCVGITATTQCLYCARIWWFWNITVPPAQLEGLSDSDMMTLRGATIHLVSNVQLIAYILIATPNAVMRIVDDWLKDTYVFVQILQYVQQYGEFLDFIMHVVPTTTNHTALFTLPVNNHTMHKNQTYKNKHDFQRNRPAVHQAIPAMYTRQFKNKTSIISVNITPQKAKNNNSVFSRRRMLQSISTDLQDTLSSNMDLAFLSSIKQSVETRNTIYRQSFKTSKSGCIVSAGVAIDGMIRQFASTMEMNGWRSKPYCSPIEIQTIVQTPLSCPIVEAPVLRIINNIKTLIRYYSTMSKSECLTKMTISCLPNITHKKYTVASLLPRPPHSNETNDRYTTNETQPTAPVDFMVDSISYVADFVFSFLGIDVAGNKKTLMSLLSTAEILDSDLYSQRIRNGEYTLGRIIRDMTTCSFEESINCSQKRTPLILAFCTNFVAIFIFLLLVPTPSVFIFFAWTIGLTTGVLYMSYNFSPLCFPRIPTCIGIGLFEVTNTIFPVKLQMPATLVNTEICNTELLYFQNSSLVNATCLKQCNIPEVGIDTAFSIFIAIESSIYGGKARICSTIDQYIFQAIEKRYFEEKIFHFETVFSSENNEDLRNAILFCSVVNIHKIIAFFCIVVFIVPFVLYTLQFIFTVFFILITSTIQ